MYNRFQLAKKYLHYYFTASTRKGHGIHSPFVFDFVTKVLNDKTKSERSDEIEKIRSTLLHTNASIDVEDFGAGSKQRSGPELRGWRPCSIGSGRQRQGMDGTGDTYRRRQPRHAL